MTTRESVAATAYLARETPEKRARQMVLRAQARAGNYEAYRRLNGFTADSTPERPVRLMLGPAQRGLVDNLTAHLRCRFCGVYHGQYPIKANPVLQRLELIKCPKCGKDDCRGAANHAELGGKIYGKTEEACLLAAYTLGYLSDVLHIKPRMVICAANREESANRMGMLRATISRPGHRFCFGESQLPLEKPSDSLYIERYGRKGQALCKAYGGRGLPNGYHVHFIWWDDGSNMNTEWLAPKVGLQVERKFRNGVMQSRLPCTALVYLGNICLHDGLNAKILKEAKDSPDFWTYHEMFCTLDPQGLPVSYCEELLPTQELRHQWLRNEREVRRTYMGQAMVPGEMAYQTFALWVPQSQVEAEAEAIEKEGVKVVPIDPKRPDGIPESWARLGGVDLGFTGSGAADKRGRSRTGMVVLARHPTEAWLALIHAEEKYLAPGEHVGYLCYLAEKYGIHEWSIEASGAPMEIVVQIERAGFAVETYNPSDRIYGGSKENRKFAVATAVNNRMVRFMGRLLPAMLRREGASCALAVEQEEIVAHLGLYPAESFDDHDALEIAVRWFCNRYGLFPALVPKTEIVQVFVRPWMVPHNPSNDEREMLDTIAPLVLDSEVDAIGRFN